MNKEFIINEFKFIFSFLIFSSVFYFIVSKFYSANTPIVGTWTTAFILNNLLRFFGINSFQMHNIVFLPGNTSIKIIVECTGLYEIIILCSMILSYPTSVTNKLYGINLGLFIINTLNMIRLMTISYTLMYYNNALYFVDTYLWQTSMIIFISLTYIIWLKLIR